MLITGSQAMQHHFPEAGIVPKDTDIIGTMDEFRAWSKTFSKGDIILCKPLSATKMHVRTKDGWNYEFEIASPGDSSHDLLDMYGELQFAPKRALLMLKLSHRYRRNSPHFLKTMRDIQFLRAQGVTLTEHLEKVVLPRREAETYTYAHPKLDVSKSAFFDGDGVPYVYDHDTIHETVAIKEYCHYNSGTDTLYFEPRPAYTFYMKDGEAVMTSKEKFFAADEEIRLLGVYEESCVLALERSQIPFADVENPPHPRKSFEYALMKVCTSITSGFFRAWAYDHYDDVIALYNQLGETDYIDRFKRNQHLLKPYKEGVWDEN